MLVLMEFQESRRLLLDPEVSRMLLQGGAEEPRSQGLDFWSDCPEIC